MFSCRQQRWKSQSCARSRGAGNAGHCWDRRCRQGSACQGTWAVIVINVDIAGNGRAGASSKCTEAGNEPHQFLRCQLFHGAAAETGKTGPCLLGRSCPRLAAGCKHTPPVPWGGSASLPAGRGPREAGNGPSSVSVLARLWVTVGYSSLQPKGVIAG